MSRRHAASQLEPALNETKDPLIILDIIHENSQLHFINLLTLIQENKNTANKVIDFYEYCFLWPDYKMYTSKLIQASHKIINDINIPQSLTNQAKREIEVWKETLKRYQQQNNAHAKHTKP